MSSSDRIPGHTTEPPVMASGGMTRERLLERLDPDRQPGVVLVCAPAGYGKTMLLGQHFRAMRARGRRAMWVGLDRAVSDEQEFARRIWASAEQLRGAAPAPETCPPLRAMSRRELLNTTLFRLLRDDQPATLCLDDFHLAASPAIVALTDELIAAAGHRVQFVIASRERPELKVGRLAASANLCELTVRHLAFSETEAHEFLCDIVSAREADILTRKTEGWPAGLQLCRFMCEAETSTASAHDVSESLDLDRVTGRLPHIATYMAEQVFERLDHRTQTFLLQTAILDRLCGHLVDAVTDRLDSAYTLEWLHSRNLFLFALDPEHRWYRYHQLFRDFLRARLDRSPIGERPGLHRKAASWLSRHGDHREALEHACATGDVAFVANLVEAGGGWRLTLRYGTSVWTPLQALPTSEVSAHPAMQMLQIQHLLHKGRVEVAHEYLQRLRQQLTADADAHGITADGERLRVDCATLELLVAIYKDSPWSADQLTAFERQLQTSTDLDRGLLAAARELLAWVYFWKGDFERGVQAGIASTQHVASDGTTAIHTYAHMARGLCLLSMARFDESLEALRDARRTAASVMGPDCDQIVAVDVFEADIALERCEFERAQALVEPFFGIIDSTEVWVDLLHVACKARSWALLQLEGIDAARRALSGADSVFLGRELPRLHVGLALHEIRLLLLADRGEQAIEQFRERGLDALAEDRRELAECGWRMELPLLLTRIRVALTEGDMTVARDSLQRARRLVERLQAHRYQLELMVLEAALLYVEGEREAARALTVKALGRAAASGQQLPFVAAGPWIEPVLREVVRLPAPLDSNAELLAQALVARLERAPPGSATLSDGPGNGPACEAWPPGLSRRERQVFALLCDGMTSKEIARTLNISVNTAMGYRKTLYRKLGVTSRAGVVAFARRRGGATDEPRSLAGPR